jgi:hypothetical protein
VALSRVLVATCWRDYAASNVRYFSDIARLHRRHRHGFDLPIVTCMIALLPVALAWCFDLRERCKINRINRPCGLVFDDHCCLILRGRLLFHLAVPPTTIWMPYRFGDDRRVFCATAAAG